MVMHHHEPDCHWNCGKDWFAVFKVKVTLKSHVIKYNCFYQLYLIADLYATKFNWMVSEAGLSCVKLGLLCSRSRSQLRIKFSLNLCLSYNLLHH